jgi:hypothetical protein
MSTKRKQLEGLNRKIFRTIRQWFDARNVEIENLLKYKSIFELTNSYWVKLTDTILRTNSSITEDFLHHKLSIVYLQKYLSNPALSTERRKIFGRGRIRKLLTEDHLSLFASHIVLSFMKIFLPSFSVHITHIS